MTILIERRDRVAVIRLNRPKAMNSLSSEVMEEIVCAMQTLDRDPQVGCFVLTGSEKVFAAGADIKEMRGKSYMDMFNEDFSLAGITLRRYARRRLPPYRALRSVAAANWR